MVSTNQHISPTMEQTITVRFVCDILEWNWTDIQLSHNFPTLTPLYVNRIPRLHLTFTMGNTQGISNDFYFLTDPQKHHVLEECMAKESISWAMVAHDAAHRVNDHKFLNDLIAGHMNGNTVLPPTPLPNTGTAKRVKISASSVKRTLVFPDFCDTTDKRDRYTRFAHSPEMMPATTAAPATPTANVNTMDGNQSKTTDWANDVLAPTREDNWIATTGPGISSFYSNPSKAVRKIFNWHDVPITDNELSKIKYIGSLINRDLLVPSIEEAFLNKGIALTRGVKDFADVFACTDPEINPILIVAVAKVHEQYEKSKAGTPKDENFTVLLVLFQSPPHVCLPFSDTHMNLHLGTMCRDKDYKKHGTFTKYMKVNVNHRLVPVQNIPVSGLTILRELHFESYYTTNVAAKSAN